MVKIQTNGFKLSEYRIRKGLERTDLAKMVGVSTQTISCLERGTANPSPKVAKKIVEALGIKFDDVFTIKGN